MDIKDYDIISLHKTLKESIFDDDEITAAGEEEMAIGPILAPESEWAKYKDRYHQPEPVDKNYFELNGNSLTSLGGLKVGVNYRAKVAALPDVIKEMVVAGDLFVYCVEDINKTLCKEITADAIILDSVGGIHDMDFYFKTKMSLSIGYQFDAKLKNVKLHVLEDKSYYQLSFNGSRFPQLDNVEYNGKHVVYYGIGWADDVKTPLWDDLLEKLPYTTTDAIISGGKPLPRKIRGWHDIVATLNNPKKYPVNNLLDLIRIDKNIVKHLGMDKFRNMESFLWHNNRMAFHIIRSDSNRAPYTSVATGFHFKPVPLTGENEGWAIDWAKKRN